MIYERLLPVLEINVLRIVTLLILWEDVQKFRILME